MATPSSRPGYSRDPKDGLETDFLRRLPHIHLPRPRGAARLRPIIPKRARHRPFTSDSGFPLTVLALGRIVRAPSNSLRAFARGTLLCFALSLCPSVSGAQGVITGGQREGLPFSTSSSDWEGYSEFVRLAQKRLGTSRVRPSARLDYSLLRPSDALVIVRPLRSLDESSLSSFLADGGRVALLDDFGKGEGLLQKFGIRRISPPDSPVETLRSNPDLPIAVPSVQLVAGAEQGRHPIAEHVEAVVTNHPLVLRHPDLTPVLEIRDTRGRAEALAVTGVIAKKGRLFALGDPSVFINLMMRYPGNRALAEGLVDYLTPPHEAALDPLLPRDEEPGGGRAGKLWILANDFEQSGHYGEDEPILEQMKRHFEDAASAVLAMDEEGMPPMMATFLAALLGLWVVSREARGNLRLPPLLDFSFARAPILAAQTGLGARADILGSSKANPILALMELDAALRETAARRLGLNPNAPPEELEEASVSSGLSPDEAASLAKLLADLRTYGQSLGQGRPKKASEATLKAYHEESMRLLRRMERMRKVR